MKAGEPCRLCGVSVTEEVMKKKRASKAKKISDAHRARRELGLKGGNRFYDYEKIVRLHLEGHSYSEIARIIHSSKHPVQNAIAKWKRTLLTKGAH